MLKIYYVFYQRIRFLLPSVGWTNSNKFVLSLFGFIFFTFANISRPKVSAAGKVAWTFSIFQFLTRSIKHFVRNLHFLYEISSCGNTDTARSEKWCKRIYQVLFDFFLKIHVIFASFSPFLVFWLWSLLATKLQKYYVIFVYILKGKMGKTEKTGKKITQLKWPKYQKPKDKNMGWTKH